jgi:hypothetical protein
MYEMEAVGFSEMLVSTYQTTYHLILGDLCLIFTAMRTSNFVYLLLFLEVL